MREMRMRERERGRDYFVFFYYCLNMSIRFKILYVVKFIDVI